jgi:sec-independent protein translocase protein TatA
VIGIIVFRAGKLPEIGEGLAKSIKPFKKGMADTDDATTTTKSSEKKEEKKT